MTKNKTLQNFSHPVASVPFKKLRIQFICKDLKLDLRCREKGTVVDLYEYIFFFSFIICSCELDLFVTGWEVGISFSSKIFHLFVLA